jgi:hypothetical protein
LKTQQAIHLTFWLADVQAANHEKYVSERNFYCSENQRLTESLKKANEQIPPDAKTWLSAVTRLDEFRMKLEAERDRERDQNRQMIQLVSKLGNHNSNDKLLGSNEFDDNSSIYSLSNEENFGGDTANDGSPAGKSCTAFAIHKLTAANRTRRSTANGGTAASRRCLRQ